MKRTILAFAGGAVLMWATSVARGQGGYILLDNYSSSSNSIITYGPGSAISGTGIGTSFTVGIYYALGNVSH